MLDDTVAIILCLVAIIASLSGLFYCILKELRQIGSVNSWLTPVFVHAILATKTRGILCTLDWIKKYCALLLLNRYTYSALLSLANFYGKTDRLYLILKTGGLL